MGDLGAIVSGLIVGTLAATVTVAGVGLAPLTAEYFAGGGTVAGYNISNYYSKR